MLDNFALFITAKNIRQERPLRQPPASAFAALDALFAEYAAINDLDTTAPKTKADFVRHIGIVVSVWAVS
jgi:hypothetical protein